LTTFVQAKGISSNVTYSQCDDVQLQDGLPEVLETLLPVILVCKSTIGPRNCLCSVTTNQSYSMAPQISSSHK